MIQSKPKGTTLLSLSTFLVLAYGVALWSWISLPEPPVPFYRYLLPVISFFVALAVTIKVLWSYQILRLSKDRWRVTRPFRASNIRFNTGDITWWRETQIKTRGGPYKQLHIHTRQKHNVKLSLQEHTEYTRIIQYLRKRCDRKQKTPSA